jgi:hypothetical protein
MMTTRVRLCLLAAGVALAAVAQAQSRPAAPAAAPAASAAPKAANDGIISNPDFEKAGQNAAHAWLLLLDRKDWGTAWDASSAAFRKTVPLGTWMDKVPAVRASFGAFQERNAGITVYKNKLAGNADGDYVTVVFVSKFANKEVEEKVTTVRESDGRWRVTGYEPR